MRATSWMLPIAMACVIAVLAAPARGAPPANDDFVNADSLGSATSTFGFGTNTEADKETNEPNHVGNPGGKSVWFTWTAPDADEVSISTCNSDFDTLLAVYTGNAVGSLTPIASNDDSIDFCADPSRSDVSFTPVAGQQYRIAVDGYNLGTDPANAAQGSISLYLNAPPPPPPPPPPQQSPSPPPCPPSDLNANAVYRGTHAAGGPICFTLQPDFSAINSVLVQNVPGNACTFGWQETRYTTPLAIVNRTFRDSDGRFAGSFTDRSAQGTIVVSASGCSSGPLSWTASTDATPPWLAGAAGPQSQGPAATGAVLRAPVRHDWSWNRRGTVIKQLVVNVPDDATMQVVCRGGGCPRGTRTINGRRGLRVKSRSRGKMSTAQVRSARNVNLARSVFKNRRLRPGARIDIRITQPGMIGKFYRFKIRRNRIPKVTNRCIAADSRRLIPCP